jgi:hypothetical protein
MNARVAFDTHAFIKRLEAAGMSVPHAEALADAMGDIVLNSIATKSDLKETEVSLRSDIKDQGTSLRAEMKDLGTSVRAEMKDLELRLTLRMAAMFTATVAIIAGLKMFA